MEIHKSNYAAPLINRVLEIHNSVMDLQGRPILNFDWIENLIYEALWIKYV